MYQYSTPPLLRTSGFPTSNSQLGLAKGGMTRVAHWPWSQVPVSCTASNINITPVVCLSCHWGDLQIGGKTRVFQLHYHFLKKSNMRLRSWRLHLVPCTNRPLAWSPCCGCCRDMEMRSTPPADSNLSNLSCAICGLGEDIQPCVGPCLQRVTVVSHGSVCLLALGGPSWFFPLIRTQFVSYQVSGVACDLLDEIRQSCRTGRHDWSPWRWVERLQGCVSAACWSHSQWHHRLLCRQQMGEWRRSPLWSWLNSLGK